jgi:DNA-binding response OmpR family regulator
LSRGDVRESLTARELHLLQIFHESRDQVLSRDRLLSEVWGYQYHGTTRTLDQVIVQLRKKLGESGEPKLLLTVHGIGYRLRANVSEPSLVCPLPKRQGGDA